MVDSIRKLKRIFTKRDLTHIFILLIAILGTAVLQAAGTFSVLPFIRLVMDSSIAFENKWLFMVYDTLNFTSVNSFIIFIGVIMFVVVILSNAIQAFTTWIKIRFVMMKNHSLSTRLLNKYLSMPYVYFLNQNSSDLSKNVLSEVTSLTGKYLLPLLTIINRGLNVLFIMAILFWAEFMVSFVAFIVLGGAYTLFYLKVNKKLKSSGKMRLEENKVRFKSVKEAFGGIKEIKVLRREPFFVERYAKSSKKTARLQSWSSVVKELPHYVLEGLAYGGIIIFVLILLLTSGDVYRVIPIAGLFTVAGSRLMPSLNAIFKAYAQMQFNQAVLDRVYEDITLGEENEGLPVSNHIELPEPLPFFKSIKMENVTFNYPNSDYPVLKNINLTIKCKSMVAFIGPTGAGKTTLVDIILGLLIPQKGKLIVDDITIDENNLKNWQRMIGYVPQHIYLSDDTVVRNIAFGVPDSEIDQEAVEHVARVANIHDFIVEDLPKGYNTRVGDRGIRLSGGQRQRIGIARALYHDPEVLVFDEATSALDGVTEGLVLSALENAAESKTLLIIAHRLTTVKNCDMVYLIDQGMIVSSGAYEELLSKNAQVKAMAKLKT